MNKKITKTILAAMSALLIAGCGNTGKVTVKDVTKEENEQQTEVATEVEAVTEIETKEPTAGPEEKLEEARAYYYGDGQDKDLEKAREILTEMEDSGNADADVYYYLGRIAEKQFDIDTAKEYYQKATDNGNWLGSLAIGEVLQNRNAAGTTTANNYQQAVDNGCIEANNGLGDLYQYGTDDIEQDGAKAIEYFTLATESEEHEWKDYAYASLGEMYRGSYPNVTQDYAKSIEWLQKGIDEGLESCYSGMAEMYLNGYGVEQDYAKAEELLEKGIEAGDDWAMCQLATMYVDGTGVTQDYAKAMELYEKSASLGNTTAANNIGYMYDKGKGVNADVNKAAEYYEKAANAGNVTSMMNVARLYHDNGNTADANEWYLKAASAGNTQALNIVGTNYYNNEQYPSAFFYFKEAAEKGDALGMLNMAICYESGVNIYGGSNPPLFGYSLKVGESITINGDGSNPGFTTSDYSSALKWFIKAKEAGYDGDFDIDAEIQKLQDMGIKYDGK